MNLHHADRIFIQWDIDDQQVLRILLSRSGSVNRSGFGADVDDLPSPLCMGRFESSEAFDTLMGLIPDSWIDMVGRYTLPNAQGAICTLSIGLEGDGLDTGFAFTYGMDSEGPPEEFVQLVALAIELTDPWYLDQIARKKQGKKPSRRNKKNG